jgi:putative NIF3 family GTP cyclohydrolase 1 type 2
MKRPSEQLQQLINSFPEGLSLEEFCDRLDTYTWPEEWRVIEDIKDEIESFDWQYLWGEWYSRF